jgi:general secretion pathway protein G
MNAQTIIKAPRMRARAGFTLVEILIVVVILGILASIVIPQFSNASLQARENTLKDELRYLRTQIIVYQAQHHDCAPGYPGGDLTKTPTGDGFTAQMTGHTDETGAVNASADATYRWGPYLTRMPVNPLNGKADIKVVTDGSMTPDNTTGWIYDPTTLQIIANVSGADSNGTSYASY